MAAQFISLIGAQYIPSTSGTLFTASSATQVTAGNVTNSGSAVANFSLHIVPSGDTASSANQIIDTKRLAASESYQMPEIQGQALEDGDTIQAVASAADTINIKVSGVQFT